MELMETMETEVVHTHSQCLICNEIIADNQFISLSDENVKQSHKDLIDSIISQILEQHSNGTVLQFDTICITCFTSFKEVHEMEARLNKQKLQLMNRFKPISATITICGDPNIATVSTEEYLAPKKILDIPSSDDEEPDQMIIEPRIEIAEQPANKKLKTIEEIEEELVKIHGPADDITLADLQKTVDSQEGTSKLDEEALEPQHFIKIETLEDDKSKILRRTINLLKQHEHEDKLKTQQRNIKDELSANNMVTRDNNLYTCLLCEGDETVCGEAKAIMAHLKEAHDQRLYVCDFCGDYFRKRTDLSKHMDDHVANEEGDFQCETCNRIFNNLRLFRIHKRMHQPQNKSWPCEHCDKKYNSKNLLDEHTNIHTGSRPYQCSVCGKSFASKYTFRSHEKTHETRPRPHACSVCPKSFLNVHNLLQHEKTHTGNREFTCHLCDKKFMSQHNLEVHSLVHTHYKPFVCGLCGKAFARKAEIRDHERTHTGERPYQCEVCGATFSQRSNLQSHKRATHFDDKRHKCGDCGKAFKRRRLLEYHIKAAHTGERPFKCDLCDATFVYPEHYKKHRRIHTGEKPFRCEVCGKAFNSRDNRNSHRFIHSEKKPYECMDCGAGFMRKPLLYHHMQTENHLNDTIVVNQPRLPDDDEESLYALVNGQLQITQRKVSRMQSDLEEMQTTSKEHAAAAAGEFIITKHLLVDEDGALKDAEADGVNHLILGQDEEDGTIIIDGQRFRLKGEDEDDEEQVEAEEEETLLTTAEDLEGILTPEAIAGAQTQIIQTKEGPVQLLAVRIPNDNGEEEEAWIKILPENIAA